MFDHCSPIEQYTHHTVTFVYVLEINDFQSYKYKYTGNAIVMKHSFPDASNEGRDDKTKTTHATSQILNMNKNMLYLL